jgi:uncharacterized protein
VAKVSVASEFAGLLLSNESVEKKRSTRITAAKNKDFADLLQDSIVKTSQIDDNIDIDDSVIEKAMDQVFVLGERLRHDYALSGLAEYKQAVKNFLDIIRKRAYAHERVKGRINRHSMMQKEYNLVRTIDDKLDKLAKAVLAEQRDTLYVLSKIDEIRGLIINYVW